MATNLNTAEQVHISFNELTDSVVSRHTWRPVLMFSDSFNYIATNANGNDVWVQNRGDKPGNFFGITYDSFVVPILNSEPLTNKNFYNVIYKLEMQDALGNYAEDLNFTKYLAYNDYQTTGEVDLTVDSDYVDKHMRKWRIAIERDQNSRLQLQRLSSEYIFLKFLFNNDPVDGTYYQFTLYPFIYSYNPANY